ncbi:MAG: hypothetical protein GQ535_15900 [Rhodobacteraceae bacterium]|nr:hypothetical protein [Paracoccaceae bacterium]
MTEALASRKIAVLVSGQVRSDDDDMRRIADACKHVNADVFLCLWRKRGTKGFGGGQGLLQLSRIFGNRVAIAMPRNWIGANMRKVFPKSDHILPDLGEIDQQRYAGIFPDARIDLVEDKDELTIPYMDSNSLRMLYMINRCNRLKKQAEAEMGGTYDVVIRHRPDIVLNYTKAIRRFAQNGKTIFPKSDDNKPQQLHDIYWVGNSEDDDRLTALYHRAKSTREKGWGGIHHELRDLVIEQNIDFEKFACTTSGINEASYKDRDKLTETAQNFLAALQNRQLDVAQAGGDDFCAAFDPVFKAILTDNFPDASEIRLRFGDIKTRSDRPKLSLFKLQSLGWMVCMDPRNTVAERFSLLMLNLSIDHLTRNENAAEWVAGSLQNIFPQSSMVSAVAEQVLSRGPAEAPTGFVTDYADAICNFAAISPEELAQARTKVMRDMLAGNENWRWMSAGFKDENSPRLAIRLAETMLESGVYARVIVSQAVLATKSIDQENMALPLLETAAKTANNAIAYGDLGRYLFEKSDTKSARQALEKACSFEDSPPWINALLTKLKDQ